MLTKLFTLVLLASVRRPASRAPRAIGMLVVVGLSLGLSANSRAQGASPKLEDFISFDPPGATGTLPYDINPGGRIAGFYRDALGAGHGFLRDPDGTMTTFDASGTGPLGVTTGNAINPAGQIVGFYRYDDSSANHGFVRNPDGTMVSFDAPGAGSGSALEGTSAEAINPAGQIAGTAYFLTMNYVGAHGFLQSPDGTMSVFDFPGARHTAVAAVNADGQIAGYYQLFFEPGEVFHGFVRNPDGTMSSFDPAESTITYASAINPAGKVVGRYLDALWVSHGYLRNPDGTVTSFDPPDSVFTEPWAINPAGQVVGLYYSEPGFVAHGFVRNLDGTMVSFDAPGAGSGFNQGTFATSINPAGEIAGFYRDAGSVQHGFVWKPLKL